MDARPAILLPSAGEGGPRSGSGEGSAVSGDVAPLSRPSLTRGPPSPAEGGGGGAHRTIHLRSGADLAGFRTALRRLVADGIPPDCVTWSAGDAPGLFGAAAADRSEAPPIPLPKAVAGLIPMVVPHRDPERYALLHRLVRRVLDGERHLAEVASDPLVHRLGAMRRAIARDLHKMHAFLRFRRIEGEGGEAFVAWFEPDHYILEAAAPFFVDRFRSMDWTILTPDGSARWDGATLRFGPPGDRVHLPPGDGFEAGWRDYYESTFNPARTNLKAMRAEMPKKYW
ncbi:TIGR03915 family putative DNA repair protein, partial [uncultured Methylobacterium sp.]|uniref:TIGR03915 family putative DNA repair protein n=1 Tax=uncultured Methylobacterium sp. TaxID=157278 RepID=UPI0035CA2902